MGWAGTIGRVVVAFALPPRCPGCGTVTAADHRFCAECWQALDFLPSQRCARCDEALADDARCPGCTERGSALDAVAAAVAYGPIARTLALKLKYGRRPGIARTMALAMERLTPPESPELLPELLVVPVPLHRGRLWRRGFNQSALIARHVARQAGATLAVDLLRRTRPTPKLKGLSAVARARTVRGAFAVDPRQSPAGRRVLLVDDVFTSGATAEACARALKRAGAADVRLACWARVASPED